ncbi:MAG TPA: phospholipase D-like domain-containing protein, partial [Kofleriaceae bacterium]
ELRPRNHATQDCRDQNQLCSDYSAMRCLVVIPFLLACTHPAGSGDDVMADGKTDSPDADTRDFCNATDPRALPIDVAVTPEAGEQPYLDVLDTAQHSIDLQVYMMGYGGILDQLKAKAAAGVSVRVILDRAKIDTNQKYFDVLTAAGVQVKWSDARFVFQHSKFFIVDNQVAVISTGNFSKTYSIELERNHVATDRDAADLLDLRALFEADWAGTGATFAMPCTRLVVSPINARDRLLAMIDSAESTLEIESMQFADPAVRAAVKARVEAGVATRVLIADADWISSNTYAAQYLAELGVPVKWIPHLHTKVMIVDGKRAYLGSENLSANSLDNNREVGLIVTDASSIAPIATTFEADFATGTPF